MARRRVRIREFIRGLHGPYRDGAPEVHPGRGHGRRPMPPGPAAGANPTGLQGMTRKETCLKFEVWPAESVATAVIR
jgi:hypothetical protein